MQVAEQIAAAIRGSARWIHDLHLADLPHESSLCSVLHIQLKTQLYSVFGPISTAIFLMIDTKLALSQNMKVITL